MTDQTTAPPAGTNAYREAAAELEDLLSTLDGLNPSLERASVLLPSRSPNTTYYQLHTRALRLARQALRDNQRRDDAARGTVDAAGWADSIDTHQVQRIAQLATELNDPTAEGTTLNLFTQDIRSSALAAVLRAGLAAVIDAPSPVSVDDTPAPAEPRVLPADSPELAAWVRFSEDGKRLTVSARGIYERTQIDLVPPGTEPGAWVAPVETPGEAPVARASADNPVGKAKAELEYRIRTAVVRYTIARREGRDSSAVVNEEVQGGRARLHVLFSEAEANMIPASEPVATLTPTLAGDVLANPVRSAIADVLVDQRPFNDQVRAVTIAALDVAAEHLRVYLRTPGATPLLVIGHTGDVWTEDAIVAAANGYRRAVADTACDELRILARLDGTRP